MFLIKNDIFVFRHKFQIMNKLVYILFLLITITFFSCETDIDVNAEYEDITVVYGLLDPALDTHYIKINKAFLGATSALELAADANNFDYPAGELDVIVESSDGTQYYLTRTVNEIPKDPGIFDNSTNVLYRFVEPALSSNLNYTLKISNSALNKEITAETGIVGDITIDRPQASTSKFNLFSSTGEYLEYKVEVTTGNDIGRIEAKLFFNYYDIYTLASGLDSVFRSVEITLGDNRTTKTGGGESLEWGLKGEIFFEKIVSAVPPMSANLSHRRLDNISLEFLIAGTELSTFMSVNAPSTSVNQNRPNYTNIINGIGIFSSRSNKTWTSSIDPLTSNQINLSNGTIEYLATHSSLANRGFCYGYVAQGFPVSPCLRQ